MNHMGIAILENEAVRRLAHPLTVDEFCRAAAAGALPDNVELFEGAVLEKMTKSPRHSNTVRKLQTLLLQSLPKGLIVSVEQPLTTASSQVEPDLAVIEDGPAQYEEHHPTTALLVVEVALSSLELDREKGRVYAGAAVPEYWIVNLAENVVEVFIEATSAGYRTRTLFRPGEEIPFHLSGALGVAVSSLM